MKPKFLMRIKQCHSLASNPSTKAEVIVMRKRTNVKLSNWMQLWHGLSRVVSGALIKDYEMINKMPRSENCIKRRKIILDNVNIQRGEISCSFRE